MELAPQHSVDVITDKHDYNRQISIWLDEYEDIFSDFDPRPYVDRALSDDFINELKKVTKEDDYEVGEMDLLIPEKCRKTDVENIIVKRLHAFFRKNYTYLLKRTRINRVKGMLMLVSGVCMMLLASYISGLQHSFLTSALVIVFEPAGWFFVWTGMDMLFFLSRRIKEERDFFVKMTKTKVIFKSIA